MIEKVRISDIGEVITGNTPPTSNRTLYGGKVPLIMPTDIIEGSKYIGKTEETVSDKGFIKYKKCLLPKDTPCVVTIGSIGKKMCLTKESSLTNQAINAVKVFRDLYDPVFIFYLLKYNLPQVKNLSSGTASGRENVSKSSFSNIKVELIKDLPTQKKIASILSTYDDLIENNNQRIQLLEEMAEEIYKEWFVRFRFPGYEQTKFFDKDGKEVEHGTKWALPEGWEMCPANDLYDINIGKTPPRKEPQWFTKDDADLKWISIRDINSSTVYVFDTSERITQNGVDKFNVKIIPANTVILSFKLTIGKVAITTEEMLSNEAIAHFNIKESKVNMPYTYWFLKTFKYGELGNTSSIGSAINSKIVKKMPILNPTKKVLKEFYKCINPMMNQIRILVQKNNTLKETRDLLLPRLISGKLSVDNIPEPKEMIAQ